MGESGDVAPGEGAISRRGVKKGALYRDEKGKVHECSAVCPRPGCLVRWNGSRFSKEGTVSRGPAVSDFEPVEEAAHAC